MILRDVTEQDGAGVLAIWNHVIRDTAITFNSQEKTPQDLRAFTAEKASAGHAFLVAAEGSDILGFANYGQFRGGLGYARTMEHSIALTQSARGRGLGRRLMTALEDHARDRGVHSMFAGVSAENPAGRAFHAAMGYVEIAVLPQVGFKFGRWMDLHLMQKILT
ncbi:GNAT family N-acetyltransferase [Pseudorhodobacter sp.]|uniref:GNAT family N-acetyltransferase n=1 Tax=Pseudorhodobacter sp. TaxID=1934400 RepID=UPI002647B625|nr:GNAT family N-acetyltransferase [Pseudorhodobacter sp.]MDN5786051.1 N-acetyltransferase family protein [Pseudorhodobacter sp.]